MVISFRVGRVIGLSWEFRKQLNWNLNDSLHPVYCIQPACLLSYVIPNIVQVHAVSSYSSRFHSYCHFVIVTSGMTFLPQITAGGPAQMF